MHVRQRQGKSASTVNRTSKEKKCADEQQNTDVLQNEQVGILQPEMTSIAGDLD